MANITLGLPVFSGSEDEDIDSFIHLYRSYMYLHAIGIDPVANSDQALGIFRACFKGEAGVWYNEQILGKKCELCNLYNNIGQVNIARVPIGSRRDEKSSSRTLPEWFKNFPISSRVSFL